MKTLLLLPLLLIFGDSTQNPAPQDGSSPVVVVGFKWFKDRQPVDNAVAAPVTPQPAPIAADRNFERQKRINASAGDRDPHADTLDARGAELDRIVQESREAPPADGFVYVVKFKSVGAKPIARVFWEYQFKETANPANLTRRRFLCNVKIKPEQAKDLEMFSLGGPSDVISVKSLAKGSGDQFQETVVIDRVEYADGSFWQLKGWTFDVSKLVSKPRADSQKVSMCRGF
ncbi:MAG TPA: hypothetical protein VK117_17245 [Pyrinomonadaceae bacterium]|nr:hypothetical protein [Pyrinomonadaceae bacterium]